MIRRAVVAVLLLLPTACAPTAKQLYREPTSGATAEVTFRNATSGRTEIALFDDAANCTGRRHLSALLIGEERNVLVPADETLAFQVRHVVPNSSPPRYCEVLVSFDLQPTASYAVT